MDAMDSHTEEQPAEMPLEVLWNIFEYLDLETLLNACPYVSRSWNEAVMHDAFWAKMYSRIWNHAYGRGENVFSTPFPPLSTPGNRNAANPANYHLPSISGMDSDDDIDPDYDLSSGSDTDNDVSDETSSTAGDVKVSSSTKRKMCTCPGVHHRGGAPICPSWRASVIARLRCERVIGGRNDRWGKHAVVPSTLIAEEIEKNSEDEDDYGNSANNSESERYKFEYFKRNSNNGAVQHSFDELRDGIIDMAIWASKKFDRVPVDLFPALDVMLGSNRDEITRARDPQVTPFDWVAREAFCGREFVSEPEVILGSALELLSLVECRYPNRSRMFASFVRRALQPVFAILKIRYRSGSAEYIDGLVARTLDLLRNQSLEDKDKMYAMFYDALLSFEYGKYLIETRFDQKLVDKIIIMRKEMKFSEDELGIETFDSYSDIQGRYLNHSKSTYEKLLKMLETKELETSTPVIGPQRFTPTYTDELTSYHVRKNLGDVHAFEATISAVPAAVRHSTERAFSAYKASRVPGGTVPPSILFAESSLHISLAQRTTGKIALKHLEEATKILSELASEKWNPWNPTLVSEALGRIYTVNALLVSRAENANKPETLFLKARSEYQRSLRHEPAVRNTHDSQSMASYRRSKGLYGRIPLPSCGLVPDDLGTLLTRGYHELLQARFAMSRKSTFYAVTLLGQSKTMFSMASSFDPRGPAPIAGAAAADAEIALLYPGTPAGDAAFEAAEAQFAAVTDLAGAYGGMGGESDGRAYFNYSIFLLFSAVALERCEKSRTERLGDALAAALMAMSMGTGYELGPVFVAAYAAFLLDMTGLCAKLIVRYNGIVECENESRLLTPDVFASIERDSVDMNEFLWRFVI